MIADSSALLSILKGEPDAHLFAQAFEDAEIVRISTATYFEAALVIDALRKPELSARLDTTLEEASAIFEPLTAEQARIARQAYRDYGKGSGHRAGLNFGDCFAYALARDKREPLLYKGNDFVYTDIRSALKPR